jgi:NAD-dependent SIR2 family protein deacetylase
VATSAKTPNIVENKIIAIFGAGASKACGGLGLGDVLPAALRAPGACKQPWYEIVVRFLDDIFSVKKPGFTLAERVPDVGLVLSIIDLAVEQGRGLVSQQSSGSREPSKKAWPLRDLVNVREKLEGLIIQAVLKSYLDQFAIQKQEDIPIDDVKKAFPHEIFLDYLFEKDPDFTLVSLNYDLFLERAAMQHLKRLGSLDFDVKVINPRYDVAFEQPYIESETARRLHKLHGSMNWVYCAGCGRVNLLHTDQYITEKARESAEIDVDILRTSTLQDFSDILLDERLAVCPSCESDLRPMIIAPTLIKNYANTHLRHVWSHAESELRHCTELYFVGYSLPVDDIILISMLKRNTQTIDRNNIHVIVNDDAAIARYKSIFGPEIDVYQERFENWIVNRRGEISTFDDYASYGRSKERLIGDHGPVASEG